MAVGFVVVLDDDEAGFEVVEVEAAEGVGFESFDVEGEEVEWGGDEVGELVEGELGDLDLLDVPVVGSGSV